MRTFKNKNFTTRDYKTTNLVYCQAETAPDANWIEVEGMELNVTHLYTQAGVRYFGWL